MPTLTAYCTTTAVVVACPQDCTNHTGGEVYAGQQARINVTGGEICDLPAGPPRMRNSGSNTADVRATACSPHPKMAAARSLCTRGRNTHKHPAHMQAQHTRARTLRTRGRNTHTRPVCMQAQKVLTQRAVTEAKAALRSGGMWVAAAHLHHFRHRCHVHGLLRPAILQVGSSGCCCRVGEGSSSGSVIINITHVRAPTTEATIAALL